MHASCTKKRCVCIWRVCVRERKRERRGKLYECVIGLARVDSLVAPVELLDPFFGPVEHRNLNVVGVVCCHSQERGLFEDRMIKNAMRKRCDDR